MPSRQRDKSKDTPRVSVVIPCFNYARFVKQAIDSVLAQREVTTEVVVVDDGSTDDTTAVVQPLLASGSVQYIRQEHRGIAAARNHGWRKAQGEYVAFLDADDYWPHPDQLAAQVKYLDQEAQIHWLFGDAQPFSGSETFGEPYLQAYGFYRDCNGIVNVALNAEMLCRADGFFVPTGTVLMRREFLEWAGGFDESLQMFEDVDLWLRLARRSQAGFLPRVLLARRVHNQSSGSNRGGYLRDLKRLFDKHHLEQKGIRRRLVVRLGLFREGRVHFDSGRLKDARRAFAGSLRHGVSLKALAFYVLSFLGPSAPRLLTSLRARPLRVT